MFSGMHLLALDVNEEDAGRWTERRGDTKVTVTLRIWCTRCPPPDRGPSGLAGGAPRGRKNFNYGMNFSSAPTRHGNFANCSDQFRRGTVRRLRFPIRYQTAVPREH